MLNLFGTERFVSKVRKIARQASSQTDLPIVANQLLGCLGSDASTYECGIVYAAVAHTYGKDLHRYAENAMMYAQKALSNELAVAECCEMYMLIVCAHDVRRKSAKEDERIIRDRQGVFIIKGLSYVFDHLRSDTRCSPPSVGKYDVDALDSQYAAIALEHDRQIRARDYILLQNRLIDFCDEFCRRMLSLYGEDVIKGGKLESLMEAACVSAEKKKRISRCLNVLSTR